MGKTVRQRSRQDQNLFPSTSKPTVWLHEQQDPEEFIARGVQNYYPMNMKRDYINPSGQAAYYWTDMIPCNGQLDRLEWCFQKMGAESFTDSKCMRNLNESSRCLNIFKQRLEDKKFQPEKFQRATEHPMHKNKLLEGL